MAKNRMDLLQILLKDGLEGDVDFLRVPLRLDFVQKLDKL